MRIREHQGVVHSSLYHIVWCPKYRKPVLTDAVAQDLERIIRELAEEKGVDIMQLMMRPDSIEVLADIPPRYGVGEFVKNAKGRSSRFLRSNYDHLRRLLPTLWTHSYFVATITTVDASAVSRYIENQPRRSAN